MYYSNNEDRKYVTVHIKKYVTVSELRVDEPPNFIEMRLLLSQNDFSCSEAWVESSLD